MGKIVLFVVGIALLVVTGHYFFSMSSPSTGASSVTAAETLQKPRAVAVVPHASSKPEPQVTDVIPPQPDPTPATQKAETTSDFSDAAAETTPEKPNASDSLRFALEGVVEDSIEEDIWNEIDADIVQSTQ